jgi:hypothetical protein
MTMRKVKTEIDFISDYLRNEDIKKEFSFKNNFIISIKFKQLRISNNLVIILID